MSKKALTILILFILIILGILVYLYLLLHGATPAPLSQVTPVPTASTELFPFGNPTPLVTPVVTTGTGSTQGGTGTAIVPVSVPKLQHISLLPIAGAMASTTASSTIIRYVDRGTGHIIDRKLDDVNAVTISNTTIPKVYEAFWNKKGTALLMRYVVELNDSISTFYAALTSVSSSGAATSSLQTTPYELKGSYLLNNMKNVAISPRGDRMVYTAIDASGLTAIISNLDGTNKKIIWGSPLVNWQVEWPEENTLSFTTAPSALATGFSYLINTTNGKVTKVLGPVTGLTTLVSKDAKKVLFSESKGGTFATGFYDIKTGQVTEATFRTLPEKCVWSTLNKNVLYCALPIETTNAQYPDDWYKGKVSFTDQIWYINADTGEARLLSNLYSDSKTLIDATHLTLDNTENVLLFTNKNDLQLWSLDVSSI